MGITMQRATAASSSGAVATQTMAVQVDAGTNSGLLVCVGTEQVASSSTVTHNGTSMTFINGDVSAGFGSIRWFYLAAPATGTLNIVATPNATAGTRIQAWVFDGVHQSTAPTFLLGTPGTTITWSWTSTVGAMLAFAAKRGGSPTWTIGGGGTEDSNTTLSSTVGTGGVDTMACGHLLAATTSEAPTYTLSGGDSSTNVAGSVQWLAAAGGGSTPLRPWFFG